MIIKLDKKVKAILFILCILLFMNNVGATEQENGPQKNIDFSVKAIQPKTQIDKSKTYLHVQAKRGTSQKVEFEIKNTSMEEKKIIIKLSTALTNKNGVVVYDGGSGNEKASSNMQLRIEDVVKIEKSSINVGAGKTAHIKADIKMPDKKIDGILLGGVNFSIADEGSYDKSGVESKYQYNIAFIIDQNKNVKLPTSDKLDLIGIETLLSNGNKVTSFNFENSASGLIENLSLDFKITKKGDDKTILEYQDKEMGVAPNSIMNYHINWGVEDIKAGQYTAKVIGKSKTDNWEWEMDFEIKDEQAKKINKEAINKLYYPSWFNTTVLILSVITIVNLVVALKYSKKVIRG